MLSRNYVKYQAEETVTQIRIFSFNILLLLKLVDVRWLPTTAAQSSFDLIETLYKTTKLTKEQKS
jgi:hypothetical protein